VQRETAPSDFVREMNKTERHRAIQLEAMKRDGQIRDWGFEAMSLKLGAGAYYTPDFMVIENDGTLRFEETKGFWRESARVNQGSRRRCSPANSLRCVSSRARGKRRSSEKPRTSNRPTQIYP
jgi:hypothetical protein